jgi:predicted solute-binding protein
MQRRIGIIPDRCARPLFSRFREPEFGLLAGTPGELAVQLRGRKLDGAFLSPVDAVKHPGTVRPAGSGALVSLSASGTARLLFRGGIRKIDALAVDPGRTSEIVLAHLVLVEKYGSAPKIIPRTTSIDDLPASVDALLLTGDEAGRVEPSDPWIDLVDDWLDIAGLPFVHGLWFTAGEAFGAEDAHLFGPPGAGGIAAPGSLHEGEGPR